MAVWNLSRGEVVAEVPMSTSFPPLTLATSAAAMQLRSDLCEYNVEVQRQCYKIISDASIRIALLLVISCDCVQRASGRASDGLMRPLSLAKLNFKCDTFCSFRRLISQLLVQHSLGAKSCKLVNSNSWSWEQ